jgi:DNA-binding NarL/FixJ family response regulator
MSRIKILMADDHRMFGQGLESLLRDDFDFLGRVEDGEALVDAAMQLDPDVIIVDISMPVLNGFDAVRKVKKLGCRAKVIFLTMHADESLVDEAFRCGASGYILKQAAGEELISAIGQVADGKTFITSLVTKQPEFGEKRTAPRAKLTPRQTQVLTLIAQGKTMKEIASELGISTRTAESHKYEIMAELGLNSTAELVQYAIRLGLITL